MRHLQKRPQLYDALQEESEAKRLRAAEILCSLVKAIILTSEDGALQIDVRGDLAGILAISLKKQNPRHKDGGSQFELVAGAGFIQERTNLTLMRAV